jgi:exopolyphosphatase/guanosine-5'-triphosphate,3'-diphosphate pyrophosphatase
MIAIDLGSNTLRVLEYDCISKKQTFAYEKVVKTADGLATYGRVSEATINRVISALNNAQIQLDFAGQTIKAVTTETLRRATNAKEVLLKIKKETGVEFEIISGEEEARLTLLAVKNRLSKLCYASDSFVLVDIGGGSTEITFHYEKETISRSFPVGIVTISQSYQTLEEIEEALPKEMLGIQMFCTEIMATKGSLDSFVATAGTPTTIASLKLGFDYKSYDAQKVNGTTLKRDELEIYLARLLYMPFKEREKAVGTGRSELILAGILIYKQLYMLLKFDSCVIIDDGLREGLALEECKKFAPSK